MKKRIIFALLVCAALSLSLLPGELPEENRSRRKIRVGLVTDVGGIDDKSFQSGHLGGRKALWKGK